MGHPALSACQNSYCFAVIFALSEGVDLGACGYYNLRHSLRLRLRRSHLPQRGRDYMQGA